MNDFLKAKSMVTPGVVGALVTVLTTTLATSFGAPANWTALALSFLCGLVVFTDKTVTGALRVVFYVLNSLIIFSTAVGTNGLAVAASGGERPVAVVQPTPAPLPEVTAAHTGAVVTVTPSHPAAGHPAAKSTFFRPWFTESAAARAERVVTPAP